MQRKSTEVGLFGVYWHVVLPLVSRTFGLFAVLTLLTLAVSFFRANAGGAVRGAA